MAILGTIPVSVVPRLKCNKRLTNATSTETFKSGRETGQKKRWTWSLEKIRVQLQTSRTAAGPRYVSMFIYLPNYLLIYPENCVASRMERQLKLQWFQEILMSCVRGFPASRTTSPPPLIVRLTLSLGTKPVMTCENNMLELVDGFLKQNGALNMSAGSWPHSFQVYE